MFSQKQNKKYHSKTQLDEKKPYLFMMFLSPRFSHFSTARQVAFALHNKKITVVTDFKAAQPMRG